MRSKRAEFPIFYFLSLLSSQSYQSIVRCEAILCFFSRWLCKKSINRLPGNKYKHMCTWFMVKRNELYIHRVEIEMKYNRTLTKNERRLFVRGYMQYYIHGKHIIIIYYYVWIKKSATDKKLKIKEMKNGLTTHKNRFHSVAIWLKSLFVVDTRSWVAACCYSA